tara:strand:+ start:715 stop:1218 length:504 start_codon:yes stop_codon:yes gene_type:complete
MKNKFIIAIGSNIHSPEGFSPIKNCNNAITELSKFKIKIVQKSSWYLSEPIPKSTQPKFYNSVVLCYADHNVDKVLKIIQIVEHKFGRIRIFKNMPRCIDIDIISFNKKVKNSLLLTVPHPRMHLRKFVLLPLLELDPKWSHPLHKKNIRFLVKKVKCQKIKKLKID